MKVRTSNDLTSSLRGSAFRRLTCDGRTRFVRAVRTSDDLVSSLAGSAFRRLTCDGRTRFVRDDRVVE